MRSDKDSKLREDLREGDCFLEAGRHAEAARAYRAALVIDPTHAEVRHKLIQLYRQMGQDEDAWQVLTMCFADTAESHSPTPVPSQASRRSNETHGAEGVKAQPTQDQKDLAPIVDSQNSIRQPPTPMVKHWRPWVWGGLVGLVVGWGCCFVLLSWLSYGPVAEQTMGHDDFGASPSPNLANSQTPPVSPELPAAASAEAQKRLAEDRKKLAEDKRALTEAQQLLESEKQRLNEGRRLLAEDQKRLVEAKQLPEPARGTPEPRRKDEAQPRPDPQVRGLEEQRQPSNAERPASAAPKPAAGSLRVTASPWAEVYLEGTYTGKVTTQSPLNISELKVGEKKLRLVNSELNAVWETTVTVKEGQTTQISHTFPQFGTLMINAYPWGMVYINGVKAGETPLTKKLPAGGHQVRITRDGFPDDLLEVSITPNETRSLNVR